MTVGGNTFTQRVLLYGCATSVFASLFSYSIHNLFPLLKTHQSGHPSIRAAPRSAEGLPAARCDQRDVEGRLVRGDDAVRQQLLSHRRAAAGLWQTSGLTAPASRGWAAAEWALPLWQTRQLLAQQHEAWRWGVQIVGTEMRCKPCRALSRLLALTFVSVALRISEYETVSLVPFLQRSETERKSFEMRSAGAVWKM